MMRPCSCFSVIASACCFAGQTASMVALPFYLQHELGQNTLMAGLYMTAWPLTVAMAAPFAGHLADRVSTAWLSASGGLCLATGLGAAALWPLKGDPLLKLLRRHIRVTDGLRGNAFWVRERDPATAGESRCDRQAEHAAAKPR